MAQDIKKILAQDKPLSQVSMPKGHEARFLERLDNEMPQTKNESSFSFLKIAASLVIFLGLGFASYVFLGPNSIDPSSKDSNGGGLAGTEKPETSEENTKSLGDVSPELKKVEDYYLASINLELSKVKYTEETKELFDGYLERMEELTKEYKRLTQELNTNGPNELLVNALIDNLKFRLNLLYKLRSHLNELQAAESSETLNQIS